MLGNINPSLVTATPQDPVVYRGRSNVVQAVFRKYDGTRDTLLDFSLVSRVILILPSATGQMVFDSVTSEGAFDWVTVAGRIVFDLTQYALPVGVYSAQLVMFDIEHPDGQVIIDGQGKSKLLIDVREVYTYGVTPPPLPTGGESVVRAAGEPLSALTCVYEYLGQVFALDPTDSTNIDLFLGITVSAANTGGSVVIQRQGTLDDSNWNWLTGLVYLGSRGTLTQTVPTTGWELVLGASPSPNRLNLDFDEPVLLAQEQ